MLRAEWSRVANESTEISLAELSAVCGGRGLLGTLNRIEWFNARTGRMSADLKGLQGAGRKQEIARHIELGNNIGGGINEAKTIRGLLPR